jgi:hypothetical protein
MAIGSEIVILPTMFICITLAIKSVVDSRTKRKILEGNVSQELIQTMLLAEEKSRQMSALKWGLVLTALGVSLGVIQATGMETGTPGTIGLLFGAAGIGMLLYHGITNKHKV